MSRNHAAFNTRQWARVRRAVFDRDGWRCCECGLAGRLECEHIIPMGRGGAPFALDNLQTLCRGCHVAKTRKENRREWTPDELAWQRYVEELVRIT